MFSGSLTTPSSSLMLNLPKDTLDGLNNKMEQWSNTNFWTLRFERDRADLNECHELAAQVLMALTDVSAKYIRLKDKIIASPSIQDSRNIVKGFNDEEWRRWYSGMQTGLENNNWVDLINHSKLRTAPNVALGVPIEYQNAVIRAWRLPYRGNAHKILLKAIDELHRKRNYAKIIPIVQSSGTGKSKIVDEVSKTRILFPLCLREYIGDNYFAYPLSDEVVRDHLLSAPSVKQSECKQYLRSFLFALFTTARLQAQKLFSGDVKVSYESMAMTFHGFFADQIQRNDFYEDVVQNAEDHMAPTSAWNALSEFMGFLKDHCIDWLPDGQCPLLFSLDEVHGLYTQRSIDKGSVHTLYSRLKSVFHEAAEHSFGVISLSTVSQLSSIDPLKETTPSMRQKYQERPLPAPFTELPFDVYIIDQPLTSNQATLGSVGSLEFTAKFGRPLFYSSYLTRKGLPNLVNGILEIVQVKLSGRLWPPMTRAHTIDASSIAILSARLLLDLSPTAFAKPYEEELVRNHLRMLYSVYEDRQTFLTGSSPEPLIAEAAAQITNYSFTNGEIIEPYVDMWSLLWQFVDLGLASQGAIGKLIGRTLSISAMDCAINGLAQVCELKYQTPVLVTDYYKALLTDEAWNDLRRSVPVNYTRLEGNSATKPFEEAFRDAYFHFSHYAKANDSFRIRDTHVWALWLRGTGVVCQELIDRMTPIYFSGQGNVSPETISVNLDLDKTGQLANPAHIAIQSAEALQIFAHGNTALPYIAAVHCYALTEKEGISVTLPNGLNFRGQISDEPEAPRYQIDFRGLSAYRNVTVTTKRLIRAMIDRANNTIFDKHPRRYGIESLHRMLPVLSSNPASTEWFTVPENVKETNSIPPNKRQKNNCQPFDGRRTK